MHSRRGRLRPPQPQSTPQSQSQARTAVAPRVIPEPVSVTTCATGDAFALTDSASIVVDSGNAEVSRTAEQLASLLRPSDGIRRSRSRPPALPFAARSSFVFRLTLRSAPKVTSSWSRAIPCASPPMPPAGLFHGVQTLRQLLPPQIESHMKLSPMAWTVPAVTITDRPRYSWRGAMLDVARHFFTVREVKQYIDLLALYKLNVLHLHLADDQGWRIEIKSRPKLDCRGERHTGWVAVPADTTRRTSTRRSCATRRSATSRSFPRSTCRDTRTRPSSDIRS